MTWSKNVTKFNSSPDWCYFDTLYYNYNRFALAHMFIAIVTQLILDVIKIVLMTKFDNSKTVEQ